MKTPDKTEENRRGHRQDDRSEGQIANQSKERMKVIAGYFLGSMVFIGLGVAFHSPSTEQKQSMSSQGTTGSAHSDKAKKEKCIKIDGYPEASKWHAHDGCEE